ncbi:unnamed protein product [Pedinophyceae sp. YPF-701]|nr:unnamed protein product [Pedinophyceae sp. YPF-701]
MIQTARMNAAASGGALRPAWSSARSPGALRRAVPAGFGRGARLVARAAFDEASKSQAQAQQVNWGPATVIENRAESADGSLRTLVLSVEDNQALMSGRSFTARKRAPRWIDGYTAPGQFIAMRPTGDEPAPQHLGPSTAHRQHVPIATSPYESRSRSAQLDAAIVEVLVDRHMTDAARGPDARLADLGPGGLVEVAGELRGAGFASLLAADVSLSDALENGWPLLIIGAGARGAAPIRAAMEWAPLQAHAGSHPVHAYLVSESPARAPYLKNWEEWRESGAVVNPLYTEQYNYDEGVWDDVGLPADLQKLPSAETRHLYSMLKTALFGGEKGLEGCLGCPPYNAAVLLAGVPGPVAAQLQHRLVAAGVQRERIMFCEFF